MHFRMGQKWQFRMLLLKLWGWRTTLDWEMLNLPDTLWVILAGFVLMAWSRASESMVLRLSDLSWSRSSCNQVKFLEPSGYCIEINSAIYLSPNKCFCLFSLRDNVSSKKTKSGRKWVWGVLMWPPTGSLMERKTKGDNHVLYLYYTMFLTEY